MTSPVMFKKVECQTNNARRKQRLHKERATGKENSPGNAAVNRFHPYKQLSPPFEAPQCSPETSPRPAVSPQTQVSDICEKMDSEMDDENYIGDVSDVFSLPTIEGKHPDLKAIEPRTVEKLMQGAYKHIICEFLILDCRYTYEFEHGHIAGATSISSDAQLAKLLSSSFQHLHAESVDDNNNGFCGGVVGKRRKVLVFYCEFSSKRGPTRARQLRQLDRTKHESTYPSLDFPEIYLLHGGYKNFYEQCPNLCDPQRYLPMLDSDHRDQLKVERRATSRKPLEPSYSLGPKNPLKSRLLFE